MRLVTIYLAIVAAAPSWTTGMSVLMLGTLLIAGILIWVGVLRRRVRRQEAELVRAYQTAQAISDLSAAMDEVSRTEKFDTTVSVQGIEEIAGLVVGFNRMLGQLLQKDHARREAEERLKQQALVDDLTGLPNRRLFSDRLTQSVAAARRQNRPMALLYIDLDGFKLVNDSLGHAAGDLLLAAVGQRLRSRVRESDTLARIGGDEFALILNHISAQQDAHMVAESLLQALVAPFAAAGHELVIGASIGISTFPDHGGKSEDLLQQADSAMYAAKLSGKNRIVFFSEDLAISDREIRQRLLLSGLPADIARSRSNN